MEFDTTGKRGGRNGNAPAKTGTIRHNRRPIRHISWSEVDASELSGIITLVEGAGGAVMFGRTSDGGALSFMVLLGEQKIKEYPTTAQEVLDLFHWLREDILQ